MSKRNKVNPGQYTQAGRLSPDDAAREERKAAGAPPASAPVGTQSSSKSGSRSTAQKTAEAKYVERTHPASEKVEGTFGRETGEKQ